MTIENKFKLFLIDNSYVFPEWLLCEQLFGNFGEIKENEDVFIDDKFAYHYNTKENYFTISSSYIHYFDYFCTMKGYNVENRIELIRLYIEHKYKLNIMYLTKN
jgi:hypothetical protein